MLRMARGAMRLSWFLMCVLGALVFAGLAVVLFIAPAPAPPPPPAPLEDYLPLMKQLQQEQRVADAVALGDYVQSQPDLPNAGAIVSIRDAMMADNSSWYSRGKRFVRGFFTGHTEDGAELAGTVVADFTVYGNIRDLSKETYHKYRGEPVDKLLVALSMAGLSADVATYFPPTSEGGAPAEAGFSLLKALRRAGSISVELGERLLELVKDAKAPAKAMELARCTAETLRLYRRLPLGTIATVAKDARTTEDVALMARWAEKAPTELATAARVGDRDAVEWLRAEQSVDQGRLAGALRYGRRGLAAAAPAVNATSKVTKFVYLGHLSSSLQSVADLAAAYVDRLIPSRRRTTGGIGAAIPAIAFGAAACRSVISGLGALRRRRQNGQDLQQVCTHIPEGDGGLHSASSP